MKKIIKTDQKKSSGLSAFIERPVPTDTEVAGFEKVVKREARHQEIDSNLTEIYSDKKGDLVDVKKMKKTKKQTFIIRAFRNLLIIGLLGIAAYFSYFYFFTSSNNMSDLEFYIDAPEKIKTGEEFSYDIKYSNPTKFSMTKIRLELKYPENFIFIDSSVTPESGSYGFNLANLSSGEVGSLTVTGYIAGQVDSVNVVSGRLNYTPLNFSSQFKKESSDATVIEKIGFQTNLEYSNTVFVDQDNEITVSFSNFSDNYLGDFNLKFILPGQSSISLSDAKEGNEKQIIVTSDGTDSWLVSGLSQEVSTGKINFKYQINELLDEADIVIRLEKKMADGQTYTFWEKTISPEIIKSDLNLTLFLNGSKNNGSADFNDNLNYTLSYSNKGENTFKDAVLMVALDGFFLDWDSLKVDSEADIRLGKMIVYTKEEIPALAEIKSGDEGEINFSIALKDYQDDYFGEALEVSAYSQYGVNNKESKEGQNKSNIIVTSINSDLSLVEKIRYFDENNSPVGSGSLPPKVGEKSSFRIYWTVTNNLHELSGVKVVLNLPEQVVWDDKMKVEVGSLYYDKANHSVIWNIGKAPVSVYQFDASFSIAITPTVDDINKILVLSPGSIVSAKDEETQATMSKKTEPKTTKLEDDDIASLNNSGRVE